MKVLLPKEAKYSQIENTDISFKKAGYERKVKYGGRINNDL